MVQFSDCIDMDFLMVDDYLRQYGFILIISFVAVIVPTSMLLLSWIATAVRIRPHKPNPIKYTTYECGVEPIGSGWTQFNFRYYFFALLFVIFDVETVFIYPWAVQFNKLGLFALIEMLIFIAILVVAWLYALKKKALEWEQI